jgi:hypothetical protein
VSFERYVNSSRVILTIHSKTTDLEKNCSDYTNKKKSFNAELSFSAAPISDQFNFKLSNDVIASTSDFENPFTVGETLAKPLSTEDTAPWTVASGDIKKFRVEGITLGFARLLNAAINARTGNTVIVDLSDNNGLACDLAFGYIKPVITKTLQYERGLPNKKFPWITKEIFSDMYKSFWMDHSKLKIEETNSQNDKSSEMFLLGMKAAEREEVKKIILESPNRPAKLLNAIKFNSSILANKDISVVDPVAQWNQTFDYVIPPTIQVKSDNEIASGAVFVSIVE